MAERCDLCQSSYFSNIHSFYQNDEAAIDILQKHGVLPSDVDCPFCNTPCTFRESHNYWRCRAVKVVPKTRKRKQCSFVTSNYKGTFLFGCRFPPWKLLLLVNHFLSKHWDYKTLESCLGLSKRTIVDWRSFCSEVTEKWLSKQEPIGGEGVVVEIDETLIVRRKYNRGRLLKSIWLFGGIERITKRVFVIPLTTENCEKRDKATLIPLVQKYILPGSIIYSDCWAAYKPLCELGYQHDSVNHSTNFVSQENPDIHTQNIERLWRDVKQWIRRPGIRKDYLEQYLSRYLFIRSHNEKELLHHFLKEAAKLYPPQSENQRTVQTVVNTESKESSESSED